VGAINGPRTKAGKGRVAQNGNKGRTWQVLRQLARSLRAARQAGKDLSFDE